LKLVPFILLSAVFVLAENEKSTAGCPDYKRPPDKLFYWPMPSDIAKRERRDVNERTTAAQNQQHFLTWDRNNNGNKTLNRYLQESVTYFRHLSLAISLFTYYDE